jgi:hypothetical protein
VSQRQQILLSLPKWMRSGECVGVQEIASWVSQFYDTSITEEPLMPKFYVQCASIETVLIADSAEQAALSALDRSLQQHLWIYDDAGLTNEDRRLHLMLEALLHLDPTIKISEQGFDRSDAVQLGAPETVDHWHKLMVGMSRLFVAAGLAPRSMSAVAGVSPIVNAAPRNPR